MSGFSIFQAIASYRCWHLDRRWMASPSSLGCSVGDFSGFLWPWIMGQTASSSPGQQPASGAGTWFLCLPQYMGQADMRLLQVAAAWCHGGGSLLVSLAIASLSCWHPVSLCPPRCGAGVFCSCLWPGITGHASCWSPWAQPASGTGAQLLRLP